MENPTATVKETFGEEIDQLDEIPALPTVITRLLSKLDQEEADAADIGNILKMDPGLTAKVFKLINSEYYGLNREINSIQEAVSYLGFETIRNLAISTSVIDKFSKHVSKQEGRIQLNWYELWKHSIATGIAAETVGRHIQFPTPENAMAAGILHRLGLVVLQSHFSNHMNKIVKEHRRGRGTFFSSQREVLGFDEQKIGLWITHDWDFPDVISSGIGYHLRPLEFPDESYSEDIQMIPCLVNVGKNMAHKAGYTLTVEQHEPVLNPKIMSRLDLDEGQLTELMNQFQTNLDNAQVFMTIVEELEEQQ